MLKSTGHTITEYALCLALLGVLALGSLKLLGGNVSGLLGTPTNSANTTKTKQLYALIGGNATGNGTSANASGTYNLQVDPTTGQIVISDTAGGGKNTTSVAGDQMMSLFAQQMQSLSEIKMADGQALPSTIKAQILKLMQDGVLLSNTYAKSGDAIATIKAVNLANANDQNSSGSGSLGDPTSTYPQTLIDNIGSNIDTSLQFQEDFSVLMEQLKPLVKQDPTLQNTLVTPISQLAGGITSINYNNLTQPVLANIDVNATDPNTFINSYANNPNIQQKMSVGSVCNKNGCREKLKQSLAEITSKTLVGTVPTANSTVTINLSPTTAATPTSSTIAGTIPTSTGGTQQTTTQTNVQASIDITPDSITASTTVSAP